MVLYWQTSNPLGSGSSALNVSDNSSPHNNPIQICDCSCCFPSTRSHPTLQLCGIQHVNMTCLSLLLQNVANGFNQIIVHNAQTPVKQLTSYQMAESTTHEEIRLLEMTFYNHEAVNTVQGKDMDLMSKQTGVILHVVIHKPGFQFPWHQSA